MKKKIGLQSILIIILILFIIIDLFLIMGVSKQTIDQNNNSIGNEIQEENKYLTKESEAISDNKIPSSTASSIQNIQPNETPSYQSLNKEERNIKICIDAGHGITNKKSKEPIAPGSNETKASNVSGTTGNHLTEEEFNLIIAKKLQNSIENMGIQVVMTRTENKCDLTNIERAEIGNSCDFVIRIHADGSEDRSISGMSVLVPGESHFNDNSMVTESYRLGEFILNNTIKTTGAKNKGIVKRFDLTGFNWSKVPVVLIECGFMSNEKEELLLADSDYQDKIVNGIADGIKLYIN